MAMVTAGVVEIASPRTGVAPSPLSPGKNPGPPSRIDVVGVARRRARRWRVIRMFFWVAFALWFVALVVVSASLYRRFFLAEDFGIYNQAWTLVGRGHLNPYNTVYGYPFFKADFELIIGPLALLHVLFPQPFVLLVVQDMCIAGSGLVACLWIIDVLERSATPIWAASIIAAGVVLITVVSPVMYQTVFFDVHLETISTLFLLLAGRDLWNGRSRRAWVFAGIILLCGSAATISLLGLGISAVLAGRSTRRQGLLFMAAGFGWLVVINLLHAAQASSNGYAYLADRSSLVGIGGLVAVAGAVVVHPLRVVHQLHARLTDIWALLRPAGVIGLASSWGFGVPVVVLLTDSLNSSPVYITQGFQNFAVYPFVLVGTVMVLTWIAARLRPRHILVGLVGLVGLALACQAMAFGFGRSPGDVRWFLAQRASPAQAAQLQAALAKTPNDAEVISVLSVMGRFCGRPSCYSINWYRAEPVQSADVVFVFAPNYEGAPLGLVHSSIDHIRNGLHARVLADADGVTVLEWRPPVGTKQVTLP
jgi:uncharacterized membrane protein